MNYNPNDKDSVRQAMLAAMVEIKGYNSTVRQLTSQLKLNPNASAIINADKAFLKHKCSAKKQEAPKQEDIPNPAPPAPVNPEPVKAQPEPPIIKTIVILKVKK